jgi:hypothetical protein
MKVPYTLVSLAVGVPGLAFGQNLINTTAFYNPDFSYRHTKTTGISLLVDNSLQDGQSATEGNVTWRHRTGGYAGVQATELLGAHLSAVAQTSGNSLSFGRAVELQGAAILISGLVSEIVSANVLSTWQSTADVGGLAIAPDQLYRVSFNVATAPGLPVGILSNVNFSITSPTVTLASGAAATLLSLGTSNGVVTYDFKSSQALSALTFQFGAQSTASLGLLGGTEGNETFVTFSGMQVTAIPEPSALAISSVALGALALRRRRSI